MFASCADWGLKVLLAAAGMFHASSRDEEKDIRAQASGTGGSGRGSGRGTAGYTATGGNHAGGMAEALMAESSVIRLR